MKKKIIKDFVIICDCGNNIPFNEGLQRDVNTKMYEKDLYVVCPQCGKQEQVNKIRWFKAK